MASSRCQGRLLGWLDSGWGFVALGVVMSITAFLLGAVYFSIRAITTSLEHIDIVPTYATALLMSCVGILTMFIFRRRGSTITIPTLVLVLICIMLTSASFILLLTRVIHKMVNFRSCHYNPLNQSCHCYTDLGAEVIYNEAPSCMAIEKNLLQLAYAQACLFLLALILCFLTTLSIIWVIHRDRKVNYLMEDEDDNLDPDFETLRADHLTDPLIGQYRQLFSREIALPPSYRPRVSGDFCRRESSTSVVSGTDDDDDDDNRGTQTTDTDADIQRGGRDRDAGAEGDAANCHAIPATEVVSVAPTCISEPSPAAAEREPQRAPGRESTSGRRGDQRHAVLWDGFCRRPHETGSLDERRGARREPATSDRRHQPRRHVSRSHADGGQWSFRPLLLPVGPGPETSGRPRRSREQQRSPGWPGLRTNNGGQNQPYLAFLPLPYSLYQPSSLFDIGISPFPMEPPPPYVVHSDPPAYTSRATSPARQPLPDNTYNNLPHDIIHQTRI